MNQTLAVAVQAAKIKGNYLHGKYYYAVDCTDCDRSKELIHTHFLFTHLSCLEDSTCVTVPAFAQSDINDLLNQSPISIDCAITIAPISTGSCGTITITKL